MRATVELHCRVSEVALVHNSPDVDAQTGQRIHDYRTLAISHISPWDRPALFLILLG